MPVILFKRIITILIAGMMCLLLNAVARTAAGIKVAGSPVENGKSHLTGDGQFNSPGCVATDGPGNIYVADTYNNRVQNFSPTGRFITKWGCPGSGDGQFNGPMGIAVDGSGNIYVADTFNNRIHKFSPDGAFITKWVALGLIDTQFNEPVGIDLDLLGISMSPIQTITGYRSSA